MTLKTIYAISKIDGIIQLRFEYEFLLKLCMSTFRKMSIKSANPCQIGKVE
jgi:hypothetical protein